MKKKLILLAILALCQPVYAADKRIPELTAQSEAIANDDLILNTDVSDTTDHASGSSKKLTWTQIRSYLSGYYGLAGADVASFACSGDDLVITFEDATTTTATDGCKNSGNPVSSAVCSGDDLVLTLADASTVTATDACATADGGTGAVDSVNGATGVVVLDADDIDDTSTTNKFTTTAEKSTWNNKQDALTNPIVRADLDTTPADDDTVPPTSGALYDHTVASNPHSITTITGNAGSATVLQTARTIGGVSFDGSANINLPGVNASGNQNTSGTAAGLTAQYVDWNSGSGGSSIANKPTIPTVDNTAYNATSWDSNTDAPTKNVVRDYLESFYSAGSDGTYGLILNNNTASYTDCTSGVYGINFVAGTAYMCLNGTNTAIPTSSSGITDIVQDTTPQLGGDLDLNGHVITGLVIGTNVQAYDADLTTWAGITPGSNVGTFLATPSLANFLSALTGEGAYASTLLGFADAAAVRTGLGLVIGTNVQAYDSNLPTWPSTVDATEIGYLNGVTGALQTQLDARADVVASGTSSLGTSAISDGACATVVTTSATGTATTDVIDWTFNADPTSTTGYNPTGDLVYIVAYPTANNVNFKVCNKSGSSVTPGAVTLNWKVTR